MMENNVEKKKNIECQGQRKAKSSFTANLYISRCDASVAGVGGSGIGAQQWALWFARARRACVPLAGRYSSDNTQSPSAPGSIGSDVSAPPPLYHRDGLYIILWAHTHTHPRDNKQSCAGYTAPLYMYIPFFPCLYIYIYSASDRSAALHRGASLSASPADIDFCLIVCSVRERLIICALLYNNTGRYIMESRLDFEIDFYIYYSGESVRARARDVKNVRRWPIFFSTLYIILYSFHKFFMLMRGQ